MRLQWFPPSLLPSLSLSLLLCLTLHCLFFIFHHWLWIGTPDLLELTGTDRGATFMTSPQPNCPCVRNGTDDACFASAIQWKKRRAREEMDTVRGRSPSRSWGQCRARAVWLVPVVVALAQLCATFNLDTEERVVFSGPRGSYFGYSVEFFSDPSR